MGGNGWLIMLDSLRKYWPLLKPQRGLLITGILLGAVAGWAGGFGAPFFIEKVFKTIFEDQERNYALSYLIGVASLLPLVFVMRGAASYGSQYISSLVGMRVLEKVRGQVFDKIQALPLAWFERRHSGDLLSRIVADTTQVQQALMVMASEGVLQPFQIVAGLSALIYFSIQQSEILFILLLVAMAPLMAWPVRLIGKHLKVRGRQVQEALGSVAESLSENLRGVMEVRAFNLQQREKEGFQKRLDAFLVSSMKVVKYEKLSQPLMEVLAVTLVSISFVYAYRAGISFSVFVAMAMALYFTVDSIKRLVRVLNVVQRSQGALERVEQILDEPESIMAPEKPAFLSKVQGRISFRGVHFSYGGEPLFRGIDCEIEPGSVCALVGPSGAGKSTFAKLPLRFYDVDSGSVSIDGIDVRQLDLNNLRSAIALAPQAPVLFNDTVLNNILIGRAGASREEVINAAKAAQAHDFIEQLDNGYDTQVGENAVRLSGGQRQRLALARAFLKNAPILILDEATSALDSESEARIQEALEKLVKGRTVLMIAHRFSTLKLCDRILVFDQGQIVASGPHEELIRSSELYHQLYQRQLAV